MERVRHCAKIVVFRALGFATLGIATVMVGLSWAPGLAFASGAALTAAVALVLLCKGVRAPRRDYRKTEVWLLLDKRHPLGAERMQEVIGGILSRLYRECAEYALIAAAGQWLLSVAARLA